MILVNFIPSSEVVRTRWWVYDLALAASLLIGGFILTAYTLGANYRQVDAIYLRSKNLERDLKEKGKILGLVGSKNRQLTSLGIASERIFAEDADNTTKTALPFVTYQLLTLLPADMWFTELSAEPKLNDSRTWRLAGEALGYGSIAKFLGALSSDAELKKNFAKAGLKLGQLTLAKLRQPAQQPIQYEITLVLKDQNRRYAERQVPTQSDHRL